MSKKINKIGFSRLRKVDVKTLASRVINIVEGYDPETLKIKEIYDLLVEHEPQIESLDIGYGPHPISPKLNAMRRRRGAIGQGLVDQMKYIEYGKMTGVDDNLVIAKSLVMRYLQGIWHKDDNFILDRVNLFFHHLNKNEDLATAFSSLDLMNHLDNLKSVAYAVERQYNTRRQSVSARPKNPTPGIVFNLKEALEDMFKQIELAQVKNQELDYTLLINDLNLEIATFKAMLKARKSYNKKKAEEKLNDNEVVEDNEVVIEDLPEEPSESAQSTERMYPMNVEVENEENLEQVDIKKTVAVSTKQTRLPIVSTEA